MLALIKRHYCRVHMIAYLHGELSPRAQRRMAHLIHSDDICYAEYRRQRDAHNATKADLPAFGSGQLPQLERMWGDVSAEMGRPMRPETHQVARVGIVTLLLTLLLAMPFAMSSASAASNAATQPSPRTQGYSLDTTNTAQNVVFIVEIVVSEHEEDQSSTLAGRSYRLPTTEPPNIRRIAEPQFAEINTAPQTGNSRAFATPAP